jgi:class 3 adenylate cyclase/tetratricopeptide (TPR) repeat protein
MVTDQGRFSSPETYTPKHLAEKILTSKAALEGERKQVTILFADLKGSMELLADRDPEEARKLLDPVLEHMMEAVHRYEGTVNQVMGDGIMALFGAPLAHEDHAVRACYAALRMQETVKRHAERTRPMEGVPLQIRVGLNSGEVVVRSIGNDLRMDYTAVGQTTHLAARMEQTAAPGTIRLTANTMRLAEGMIQATPLGALPVKGLVGTVDVFELTSADVSRSRLDVAASRGFTPFVGREAALEHLRNALDQATRGNGQVVAVVGEPGIGKSRTVREFLRSCDANQKLLLQTGAVSYGRSTPYLPVANLLRSYFQITDTDVADVITKRLYAKLLGLNEELESAFAAVLALLELPVEHGEWHTFNPAQRRQRILDAVTRLLFRESILQPVVLVFEDLHWIDGETQAVLDRLVGQLSTARVLLLVTYRPEYRFSWRTKPYCREIRVDPLGPPEAAALLDSLLGPDMAQASLKNLLIDRANGNPFFLEESVRSLVETTVLVGERGAYQLANPQAHVNVPPSVQSVLAARIDRLSPTEKGLLQSAAVIGQNVPHVLLEVVAGESPHRLRCSLARLRSAEFLYETRFRLDRGYIFKHALTQEVAYAGLLHDQRRALHRKVVQATERVFAGRLVEHIERLAHHAVHGELWDPALAYLTQAATKAAGRSAHQQAVVHLEEALSVVRQLPESRETLERTIDLRLALRTSLLPGAEFDRIEEHLRAASSLAETLGDERRLARVMVLLTQHLRLLGRNTEAVESGQRTLAIADKLDDRPVQVLASQYLGQTYVGLGDYRRAMEFSKQALALLAGEPADERFGQLVLPGVFARTFTARSCWELGRFDEARAAGEEAIRISEVAAQPVSLMHASYMLGECLVAQGRLDDAVPLLDRSLSLCRTWHIPYWVPLVSAVLGYVHTLHGRVASAVPILVEAVERLTAMRLIGDHFYGACYLAETYIACRRIKEAEELTNRTLGLSRLHSQRGDEARLLRISGKLACHTDPPDVQAAKLTTSKPSPWPRSSGCVPSRPTATSASASSIGARASATTHKST